MKLVRQSHWHWSKPNPNTTGKLQIGIRTSIQACKRCEYVSGGKPADFLLMIETIECNELQTNEIHIMWSEYVGWVWPSQLPLPLIVAEDAQFTVSIGHMFFQHFTLSFCHSINGFFSSSLWLSYWHSHLHSPNSLYLIVAWKDSCLF